MIDVHGSQTVAAKNILFNYSFYDTSLAFVVCHVEKTRAGRSKDATRRENAMELHI